MAQNYLKLTNAALDEEGNDIILRGRIDPSTLDSILADDYQREVLPLSTLSELILAFKQGKSVPDIDLGMRGIRTSEKGEIFGLLDPVYVIDGLQRLSAARYVRQGGINIRLGAVVHFGTTRESERARFKILNADRHKLATNILIRNTRDDYPAIQLLLHMNEDAKFVMKGRISWGQRQQRVHLISAGTFCITTSALHAHLGGLRGGRWQDTGPALQKVMDKVGKNIFRENIRTFWELIDMCWGVRTVVFREGASQMRLTFLMSLAHVLSNHAVFWRDQRLFVDKPLMLKFKSFPIADPTIRTLCSAGGQARSYLYKMMVEHMNKGRRSRLLKERFAVDMPEEPPEEPVLLD